MKVRLALAMAAYLFCLFSCKKEAETPILPMVATYKNEADKCVVYCTYDDDRRLISAVNCANSEDYSYGGDSVVLHYIESGVEKYHYVYHLKSNGLASGYTRFSDGTVQEYRFRYDDHGFRIAQTLDGDTGTYKLAEILDGNLVKETSRSTANPTGNSDITTTYYSETLNYLGNENFGRSFLGASSKNLKRTETWDTPDGIFSYSFKYEIDDNSLVHKRVKILNGTDTAEVRYYTYR